MLAKRMFQNSHLKERTFDFIDTPHSVCKIVVNKFRQFQGAIFSFFVVFVFHFVTTLELDTLMGPFIAIDYNDIIYL